MLSYFFECVLVRTCAHARVRECVCVHKPLCGGSNGPASVGGSFLQLEELMLKTALNPGT